MHRASVLLAYDLGGRVTDIDAAVTALSAEYGEVSADRMVAESFNLSYINWHDPVFVFTCEPCDVALGDRAYTVTRTAYLYPWLGVLHLQLDFPLDADFTPDDSLRFYEDFVKWKNEDYLPYLERSGTLDTSLRRQREYKESPVSSYQGPLAAVVERVRELLNGTLLERPERYDFHDFRTIFLVEPDGNDPAKTYQDVLALMPSAFAGSSSNYDVPVDMPTTGIRILSSGWVSVLEVPDSTAHNGFVEQINLLIRLAHAQWYVCQAWTYLLGSRISTDGNGDEHLHALFQARRLFDADLVEVGNADLMLKHPLLISVSNCLAQAFNLDRHRRTAIACFDSVAHAESKHIERKRSDEAEQRSREADRLQLLFSISAAAAIAALVPELAGAPVPVAIIGVMLATLFWLFFVRNIAVLARRIRRRRQNAKARRAAKKASAASNAGS